MYVIGGPVAQTHISEELLTAMSIGTWSMRNVSMLLFCQCLDGNFPDLNNQLIMKIIDYRRTNKLGVQQSPQLKISHRHCLQGFVREMMTFVYNETVFGKNCFYFLVLPAVPSLSPLVANCWISSHLDYKILAIKSLKTTEK